MLEALRETSTIQGKKIPKEIKDIIKNRNKIRKAWKRSKDPALKNCIKKLNNIIKKKINLHKSNSWANITNEFSNNSTALWKKVAALRKNDVQIPPLVSDTGSTAISLEEKAELIADCWQAQFSPNPTHNHVSSDSLIISAAHHYLHEPHRIETEPSSCSRIIRTAYSASSHSRSKHVHAGTMSP
ncbi:hypothetical protein CEXT_805601 [Caerostris extrusa]|uniref:Uncharacterized protein n=1 Tax=Caerostris extrusa TaxID=172846 RepID=A0AAV4WDT9_CAEEX|nr:hypothetical protein CEXT_805601 [Caerostris extrusa]